MSKRTPPRPLTLQEIRMKAAANAARGVSLLPMDRLRTERAKVIEPDASDGENDAVENAVANMTPPEAPTESGPPLPVFNGAPLPALDPTAQSSAPFVDELAHATIQLGMWEKKIGQKIVIGYPDGSKVRLGDLLMQLGEYLLEQDQEKTKTRILIPGTYDA